MALDFSRKGNFVMDMEPYLNDILNELSEKFDGLAATPGADHLFKTRARAAKLDPERAELFHQVAVHLLFVLHRGGRLNLRTAISFSCKMV